eukprot:TRINITY_DN5664_c0_g1_i2.p1 TRINITY_DN5664_c0_g1~~TRINITY_DN5664_c0_g1_i2.p1  ORF type:complete len:404 (-),score=39.29 TRINITY_DN5664_c0_g1_i2:122-1333(-)
MGLGLGNKIKAWWRDFSFNKALSYSTVKIVQIHDWRLGLLHWFFMFCVLAYIAGFVVVYQQRYLLLEAPVGSIRTSLMSTQSRGSLPPAANTLPYCTQAQPSYKGFPNKLCSYFDEALVLFPQAQADTMFITTRVKIAQQTTGGCEFIDNTCKYHVVANTSLDTYIADIENFTILIDHSMYVEKLGIEADSFDISGLLFNNHGNEMHIDRNKSIDVIGQKDSYDILTVGLLLEAAGIKSLDDPSFSNKSETLREDGLILLLFITYSNTYTYNTNNIRYEYTVKAVSRAKFKAVQPVFTKHYIDRVIWDRHGIRVVFVQTGMLGKFDFQTLLLSFVSGLGLVALSTLIVDLIALRLLPSTSRRYRKYKYEDTPDDGPLQIVSYEQIVNEKHQSQRLDTSHQLSD